MKVLKIALILFVATYFVSCSDTCDDLDSLIMKSLRSDNDVTKEEYEAIRSFVETHNEQIDQCYEEVFENGKVSDKKLSAYIKNIAGRRRNSNAPDIFNPTETVESVPEKFNLSVYLENSGSMDGYVKGRTNFESAVYNLLVDLDQTLADTISLFYINSKKIPFPQDISDFIEKLEPNTFKERGGNRGSTDINSLLEAILRELKNDEVAIFISDCIYSPWKEEENANEYLNNQKAGIKLIFSRKIEQSPNFSAYILKLSSNFEGYYYDMFDKPSKLSGTNRPYYLWFIGDYAKISKIINHPAIKFSSLEGYIDSYFINASSEGEPNFSVLIASNKIGKFRPDRSKVKNDFYHGITDIQRSTRQSTAEEFQFSFAIDLGKLSVSETYKINPDNYQVSEPFEVRKVDNFSNSDVHQSDMRKIKGWATHIITIGCADCEKLKSIENIEISLKRQLPQWISNSTIMDDSNTDHISGKTFGFAYLIEGVNDAFMLKYPESNSHFNVKISVKHE